MTGLFGLCDYSEMDWYCALRDGHDGPHRSEVIQPYKNQHEWMATFTGRAFYPLAPRIEDINIIDIGHALSMACRYGGHVSRFYSVAEHSVLISRAVPAPYALHGLLHDATEAYLGDMVRPLKKMMPEYRAAEDRLEQVIMRRFGLGRVMPPIVKEYDLRIVQDERAVLMRPTPLPWTALEEIEPLGVEVIGLEPTAACQAFMDRFTEIRHVWEDE